MERIEQRVYQMFEKGLIEEVSQLLETWNELGHTASQAVGYREGNRSYQWRDGP